MPYNADECRTAILSNDYVDFFIENSKLEAIPLGEQNFCIMPIGWRYQIISAPRSEYSNLTVSTFGYTNLPHLYTLLDTGSMEASGILRVHEQPVLQLRGQQTLVGIVDTGIDYTNPIFRYTSGESRIRGIWDQTIQEGEAPNGFYYGTEYRWEQINEALNSENPLEVVPSTDENGHGTFLAGIAAGGRDEGNFVGAAPEAELAIVKLKPAKQHLRDFYFIKENAVAYQDTDIILGIRYLLGIAIQQRKPIVILLGLGTNQGYHGGRSVLERYLTAIADNVGFSIITAAGNEANAGHHFRGQMMQAGGSQNVELRVGPDEKGFSLELWAEIPETYSVAIRSPTGEEVPRIPARIGQSSVLNFLLEETIIYVDYLIVEESSGGQLILMRFDRPTPGIWNITVYNSVFTRGVYNMWLPITGFVTEETVFLRPDPDITVTSPGTALGPICLGGYNHRDGSLYLNSGRGFTNTNEIKPDMVAPAVNVYGPDLNSRYTEKTGTSIAAAHAAGVAAGLFTWGITNGNSPYMSNQDIKSYMIRGATRNPNLIYPNREWGFGKLNFYNIFETLRG